MSLLHTVRYRRHQIGWQAAFVAFDLLAVVIALHLAILIGRGSADIPDAWRVNVWTGALLAVLWGLFAVRHPGYLPRPHRPAITTAHQCLVAVGAGSLTCIALLYALSPHLLAERTILLPASAFMCLLMFTIRHVASRLTPVEPFIERYLFIGNGRGCRAVADELTNGLSPYKRIVGLIPVELGEPTADGVPIVGTPETAAAVVRQHEVTHLVLCHPQPLPRAVARCVAECEAAGAHISTMEATYETLTRRAPIFDVGDDWIASLDSAAETLYAQRVKRVFDIVLAGIGLVLTGPLILLVALLVKLTSRGPAFYRQERVGLDGKPFTFAKIRTMVQDAEADTGPVWARRDDPRVTALGRVLRKLRVDELPQLWSVLIGDMSLVGPRPERPFFVEEFMEELPLYGKRLLVQPGITGWAQVHQSYDTCRDDVIEKLRYDLYYIGHMSFKLDLLTLIKTIGVVIAGRGAH